MLLNVYTLYTSVLKSLKFNCYIIQAAYIIQEAVWAIVHNYGQWEVGQFITPYEIFKIRIHVLGMTHKSLEWLAKRLMFFRRDLTPRNDDMYTYFVLQSARFFDILYCACDYLSLLGVQLNHASKRGHRPHGW